MDRQRFPWATGLALLLGLTALVGLGWANYRYAASYPGGNDFIPYWLGTQRFLFEEQSPYRQETNLAIQQFIFGRPAAPGDDQHRAVYPFYFILVFMPFAIIKDYVWARTAWMMTLELALLALTALSLYLSRWRISRWMLVAVLIFSTAWYHGLRPMINGNVAILCALFIALALWAIGNHHDVLAGFFLSLASIKPQMISLLLVFILLWAISQRRWVLLWSNLLGIVFLTLIGMLFLPDWVWQNLQQLIAYPSYTLPGTPGGILASWLPGVGKQMGWVLTVFMSGILFWEWRAARGKDFRWFLWTAYLTLTITNLIGIQTATENYIALYPALIMVLSVWNERWGAMGRGLVIFSLLALFFGLWALFLGTLQPGPQNLQSLVMFFPLPIFLLIGLYWARWWAVRPPPPVLDALRAQQEIS